MSEKCPTQQFQLEAGDWKRPVHRRELKQTAKSSSGFFTIANTSQIPNTMTSHWYRNPLSLTKKTLKSIASLKTTNSVSILFQNEFIEPDIEFHLMAELIKE